MKKLLYILLLSVGTLHADPWGKDADLACKRPCRAAATTSCPTPLIGKAAEIMIRFHQEVISPADGPRSHFIPSSSQYTLDAMRKYGFFKGFVLGCDRLMRENPEKWVYPTVPCGPRAGMKLDPVK